MRRSIIGGVLVVALCGCESDLQVVAEDGGGGAAPSSGGTASSTGGTSAATGGVTLAGGATSDGGATGGDATTGPCPTSYEEAVRTAGAQDYELHWTLTEDQDSDCPAELGDGDACSTLQLACEYLGTNPYESPTFRTCTCYLASGGQGVWDCEDEFRPACPAELPTTGESCVGWDGAQCTADEVGCWCEISGDDTAEWDCGTDAERRAGMEAIDAQTPVNQLTAKQRDEWCNWYVTMAAATPVLSPVSASGCAFNVGYSRSTEPFANVCVPWMVASQCEGNLALSKCPASVGALTDCIESVSAGEPSPLGCAPYLDTPNCSGTIVVDGSLLPEGVMGICPVVVE